MQNAMTKVKENIDTKIVVSTVVASLVIGGMVLAARKAGLGQVATVVKGG